MAKFIVENKGDLFGKDKLQRELMRNVVLTTFPTDLASDFFAKLEILSPSPEDRRALRAIRRDVIPQMKRTLPDLSMEQILAIDRAREILYPQRETQIDFRSILAQSKGMDSSSINQPIAHEFFHSAY